MKMLTIQFLFLDLFVAFLILCNVSSLSLEKTKFQKSKFFINYQLIHNKIKNAEFSDLKEDDSYKCFFGNVFPIGIFYNSLNL